MSNSEIQVASHKSRVQILSGTELDPGKVVHGDRYCCVQGSCEEIGYVQ